MIDTLTILRPDDLHVHLRDGKMLKAVALFTAGVFGRAIVMPNLVPPITTIEMAMAYRKRVLAAIPDGVSFTPLMAGYLTDDTNPDKVERGYMTNIFCSMKLYPRGATTNSQSGVTDIKKIYSVLKRMEKIDMPLQVHGEVTDPEVDIFDREAVFIEQVLCVIRKKFPRLKICFEHITTEDAVNAILADHVKGLPTGASVTVHHLLINRNAIFEGGICPHMFCLPVAKREKHRLALVEAVTSGHPAFWLGTDSAPHPITAKEAKCGCAGIFSAPVALQTCAEVFDEAHALDRLESFTSTNGARFFGLEPNKETVRLIREPWTVPETIEITDEDSVHVFRGGETLPWNIAI